MSTFEITIHWWAYGFGALCGFAMGVVLVVMVVAYVDKWATEEIEKQGK